VGCTRRSLGVASWSRFDEGEPIPVVVRNAETRISRIWMMYETGHRTRILTRRRPSAKAVQNRQRQADVESHCSRSKQTQEHRCHRTRDPKTHSLRGHSRVAVEHILRHPKEYHDSRVVLYGGAYLTFYPSRDGPPNSVIMLVALYPPLSELLGTIQKPTTRQQLIVTVSPAQRCHCRARPSLDLFSHSSGYEPAHDYLPHGVSCKAGG
jgi:hypothetical protein